MTRITRRLVAGLLVEVGPVHPRPGLLEAQPVHRVDVEQGDGVGIGGGHLLDLDAALGREHAQVLLGAAIEGEAGVVLAVDVRGVLDPQALDHVPLDVEPEDVAGVGAERGLVVGQLHAPGLAPAAHFHLRLDHHRIAGVLGHGDGLLDRVGHPAPGDGHAEPGEVLLTLVLVEIH